MSSLMDGMKSSFIDDFKLGLQQKTNLPVQQMLDNQNNKALDDFSLGGKSNTFSDSGVNLSALDTSIKAQQGGATGEVVQDGMNLSAIDRALGGDGNLKTTSKSEAPLFGGGLGEFKMPQQPRMSVGSVGVRVNHAMPEYNQAYLQGNKDVLSGGIGDAVLGRRKQALNMQ